MIINNSVLDIEGTLNSGNEVIRQNIKKWIKDNYQVYHLKISNNPNIDGKYEVSALDAIVTNKNIMSLTNGMFIWITVRGYFMCLDCPSLTSLEGAPNYVTMGFNCSSCDNLISLKGAPKEVGGYFNCSYCKSLTSLEGAPYRVGESFDCSNCKSLTSLEGSPNSTEGNFYCSGCDNLISLKGAPYRVDGNFSCSGCDNLISLEGAPKNVNVFYCNNCKSLKSIDLPNTNKIMF